MRGEALAPGPRPRRACATLVGIPKIERTDGLLRGQIVFGLGGWDRLSGEIRFPGILRGIKQFHLRPDVARDLLSGV